MQFEVNESTDNVYDILEHIAQHTGNARQALVAGALNVPMFMRVCKAALDPFITYGVKAIEPCDAGANEFGDWEWNLLSLLANRTLTGNNAKEQIEQTLSRLTPKSGELLKRIITRDLRANFSASAINKAIPGTIFTFEVMLAHKFDGKVKYPVLVEEKLDGVRVVAVIRNGSAKFYSRTGKEFLNYAHIGEQLMLLLRVADPYSSFEGQVFDGEVTDGDFNNTVGGARRKSEGPSITSVFNIFESLSGSQFSIGGSESHVARRRNLEAFFRAHHSSSLMPNLLLVRSRSAGNEAEVMEIYNEVRAAGKEGVIIKPLDGRYERKRSKAWLKIKNEETADIQITGFFEGEGKYAGMLGGFIGDFKGVDVRVGSGLSDNDRIEFWDGRESIRGDLMEVEFHEVTPDGSLRHPRFVRFRHDKPAADGPGV